MILNHGLALRLFFSPLAKFEKLYGNSTELINLYHNTLIELEPTAATFNGDQNVELLIWQLSYESLITLCVTNLELRSNYLVL